RRPICAAPSASSATGPRSGSRRASSTSCAGTRRYMDVSPEHLVAQARERFDLQDYYGAIHLLEEVVASGRAFADAHHLLGLSYSLAGQQEQALAHLDRARPNYLDAAALLGLACCLAGDGLGAKRVWEACRDRRPEDPRVEAYLAMLARNDTGAAAAGARELAPSTVPPDHPTPPAAKGRGGKRKKP